MRQQIKHLSVSTEKKAVLRMRSQEIITVDVIVWDRLDNKATVDKSQPSDQLINWRTFVEYPGRQRLPKPTKAHGWAIQQNPDKQGTEA